MTVNRNLYRALFPPHYTPRTNSVNDVDNTRQWHALELPCIRLMGTLWSFGVRLGETKTPDANKLPAAYSLRLLAQHERESVLGDLSKFHAPALFRAEVNSFLQAGGKDDNSPSESRLSLLAVGTIPEKDGGTTIVVGDALQRVRPEDVGFLDAKRPAAATALIVTPFGGQPKPKKHQSYLPAMQLVHGSIEYTPDLIYLAKLREELGLLRPENEQAETQRIVLLPDGFCLYGGLELPWQSERIFGWFKATNRQPGLEAEAAKNVLRLWFDSDKATPANWREPWIKAVDTFRIALDAADARSDNPRWLGLSPGAAFGPASLFWPEEKQKDWPLFKRSPSLAVHVEADALSLQLSQGASGGAAEVSLLLQPDSFKVARIDSKDPDVVNIRGEVEPLESPKPNPGPVAAHYRYENSAGVESFTIGPNNSAEKLELALPLIETAETIRLACSLPRPGMLDPLGLLWAFTPLANGWLHWPLPNSTPANLSRLIDETLGKITPAQADDGQDDGPPRLTGALAFDNHGQTKSERPWRVTVSDIARAEFTFNLHVDDATTGLIPTATVDLEDLALSLDGGVEITAFRQTPERLLPDRAERALGTVGLHAVSPSMLRGLEKEIWDNGRRASLALTMDKIEITADDKQQVLVSIPSGIELLTRLDADKVALKANEDKKPTDGAPMTPWLWIEHETLPAVQSLPLTAAGRARNLPLQARALAPLGLAVEPGKGRSQVTYQFTNPLGPGASEVTVRVPDDNGDLVEASFEGPARVQARIDDPEQKFSWRDELVMAPTTLPGVSLVVGGRPRPGASVLGAYWNGVKVSPNETGVAAEFRHDIVLRDEAYAARRAPSPPAKSAAATDETLAEVLFTPLPNNGPHAGSRSNGWERVHRRLNRDAAMAALDDRDMIVERSGKFRLAGVFGDIEVPLQGGVSLTDRVDLTGEKVTSIGSYTITVDPAALDPSPKNPLPLLFSGLPAAQALEGLSKTNIKRANGDIGEVSHGMAVAREASGKPLLDQAGLASEAAKPGNGVFTRTLKAQFLDDQGKPLSHEVRLVTLASPVRLAEQIEQGSVSEGFSFWCTDVPVDAKGNANFLKHFVSEASVEIRANAADRRLNHLAGFRWGITRTDTSVTSYEDQFLIVSGLVFEPMELRSITQKDGEMPTAFEIGGRIRVPVSSEMGPLLECGNGTLRLKLGFRVTDGKREPVYEMLLASEGKLHIPLVDPALRKGVTPVLSLDELPGPNKALSQQTLSFGFGNETVEAKVSVFWKDDRLQFEATGAGGQAAIAFSRLNGQLAQAKWAKEDGAGEKRYIAQDSSSNAKTTLEIRHTFSLGTLGATLKGICVSRPLLTSKPSVENISWEFRSKPSVLALRVKVDDLALDSQTFGFGWSMSRDGDRPKLLDVLQVAAGAGSVICALKRVDNGTNDVPLSFELSDIRMRAAFGLKPDQPAIPEHLPLTLAFEWDRGRDGSAFDQGGGYRLAGTLGLNNAFSWPKITVDGNPGDWRSAEFSVGQRSITHQVQLFFSGQRIVPGDLARSANAPLTLMVEAENRLHESGSRDPVIWRAYQPVRLWTASAFKQSLANWQRLVPTPVKKQHTGAGPWREDAKPIFDDAAIGSVFHLQAVGNGAIAGPLAKGLEVAFDSVSETLVVDFSAHVLLAFDDTSSGYGKLGKNLLLTSLPGIGFLGTTPREVTDANKPLAGMLASQPSSPTTVWLAPEDDLGHCSIPAVQPQLMDAAMRRARLRANALNGLMPDVPTAVTGFDRTAAHQPIFQTLTMVREKNDFVAPVGSLPAAATAFHLAALLGPAYGQKDRNPASVGFTWSGAVPAIQLYSADSLKLNPLATSSDFLRRDYQSGLARLRELALANIVPGPETADVLIDSRRAETRWTAMLEAVGRDGRTVAEVASMSVSVRDDQLKDLRDKAEQWASATLERLAPWARTGLLTLRSHAYGLAADKPAPRVITPQSRQERTTTVARQLPQGARSVRQLQHEAAEVHSAVEARGYAPVSFEPVLFGSSPHKDTGGEHVLSARGFESRWRLAGGPHALLAVPEGSDGPDAFVISDRQTAGFRPVEASPDKPMDDDYDLAPALPRTYSAGMPRSLHPTAPLIPAALSGKASTSPYSQGYAPASIGIGRVAPRAGAWLSIRAGLTDLKRADDERSDSKTSTPESSTVRPLARASEMPLHLRAPRPTLLAPNDRPRASSWERGDHAQIGARLTVIVHGPRAPRPYADTIANNKPPLPIGLDRKPRSHFATILTMTEPALGVIGPGWTGLFEFNTDIACKHPKAQKLADELAKAKWRVLNAAISVGGQRFERPKSNEVASFAVIGGEKFRLNGFDGAQSALASLPPGGRATLDLTLELVGLNDIVLFRQVRAPLFVGQAERLSGLNPVFLRFDDPEHNDMLTSPPKLDRRPVIGDVKTDIILGSDLGEMCNDHRLELALSLQPAIASDVLLSWFVLKTKHDKDSYLLAYNDAAQVWLFLSRKRPGEKDARLVLSRGKTDAFPIFPGLYFDESKQAFALKAAGIQGAQRSFHAATVDVAQLVLEGSTGRALQKGDQLAVTISKGDQSAPLAQLVIDIIDKPSFPGNPAAFALLALRENSAEWCASAALYAQGPDPAVIEIVDPRDIIDGLVRRRALHLWRSFEPGKPIMALQKIGDSGATWLPSDKKVWGHLETHKNLALVEVDEGG